MDDTTPNDALIETYGNPDLPEGTPDRPLVTFALFAYNQERYIREAVEGAFSQTWSPLEIILSDDCSSDRTFEIMREMARGYDGPHRVRVRKGEANHGLVGHVRAVTGIMLGDLMVLAAGDDISFSDRTEKLVRSWGQNVSAAYSNCDLIDEFGRIIERNWMSRDYSTARLPWLRAFTDRNFAYGATSMYSKKILDNLPDSDKKIFSEDTPLNLLLQLSNGKITHCKESLVSYRVHRHSISNSLPMPWRPKELIAGEMHCAKKIQREIDLLEYILERIAPAWGGDERINLCKIKKEIRAREEKISWYSAQSYWVRISISLRNLRRRWFAIRLFGLYPYAIVKSVQVLALKITKAKQSAKT